MDKTFDNVVKLIEAGFTKSEIDAMLMPIQAEPEPAEPSEKPEPTPEPEPVKEDPEQADPALESVVDAFVSKVLPETLAPYLDEVRASLGELTKAVQAKNINTMSTPTQTAEDMNDFLAAYINPPKQSK